MTDRNNITALILAGGNGSRLKTLVADRQKVVAEINGRPFLNILLVQLERFGLKKALICTGYMSETVDAVVEQYAGPIEITCSRENIPLGTGGAVKNALPLVKTEYFMLMNGDSFLDLNGEKFLQSASASEAVMALTKVDDVSRYGAVVMTEDNKIVSFKEKGEYSGRGLINAGVSLLSRDLFSEYCPDKEKFSIETEFFPRLVEAGKLDGFVADGSFIDIGVPEAYRRAAEIIGL
jgi:NDP-sugar pyrophosphorylase family protein